MNIIEQIKAEIERRFLEYNQDSNHHIQAAECASILDFLDTFESENPIGLEEEISCYLREECSNDDEPSISEVARHFAQWGAEHLKK